MVTNKKAEHPIQRLQLALLDEIERDGVTVMKFQIGAQSYRNREFGFNGEFPDKESKLIIRSVTQPASVERGTVDFYVRGDNPDEDDRIMECMDKDWSKIVCAVTAFNKQFMGTPEAVIDRMNT